MTGAAAGQTGLGPRADRLVGALDALVSGRAWKGKALIAVLAVALLRAFPAYDALRTAFVESTWRDALVKVEHPTADSGKLFPPASHASKLSFRLTVPLAAHVLGLRRAGMLAFAAVTGAVLLYVVLGVAFACTGSRRAALFTCMAVACAWPGLAGFHELRGGYYESAALCLLMLALRASSPVAAAAAVFMAAWTDERALLASCFALLLAPAGGGRTRSKLAAVALAWTAWLATRTAAAAAYGLTLPIAGVGLRLIYEQANIIPLGIWSGLAGGWILVAAGLLSAVMHKRRTLAAGLGLALLLTAAAALSITDVTRGMAYCLPAVFVALQILGNAEPTRRIERLAAIAAAVSFVTPTHYVEGSTGFWWLYPLPVQVLRWLLPLG